MHKMKILLQKHNEKHKDKKVKDPLIESIKEKIKEKDKFLGKKDSTGRKLSPPKLNKTTGSVKP